MEISIHQVPQSLKVREPHLKTIITQVSEDIALKAESLSFVFVDDTYLAGLHERYLDDPSKTDVITFNLGEDKIEGEIYISHDRAFLQASTYNVTFEEEIVRLMIHGLLHLAGYDDLHEEEREKMKLEESRLLDLYFINK